MPYNRYRSTLSPICLPNTIIMQIKKAQPHVHTYFRPSRTSIGKLVVRSCRAKSVRWRSGKQWQTKCAQKEDLNRKCSNCEGRWLYHCHKNQNYVSQNPPPNRSSIPQTTAGKTHDSSHDVELSTYMHTHIYIYIYIYIYIFRVFCIHSKSILSQNNVCAKLINYAIKSTRACVQIALWSPPTYAYMLYITMV